MHRVAVALLFVAACGPAPTRNDPPVEKDTTAPVTTASPAGLEQVGPLAVTLTSDETATIRYTTDGTDPRTSDTALTAENTVSLALAPPSVTVVTFSAIDAAGNEEEPHSESYTLLEDLVPASLAGRVYYPDTLAGGQLGIAVFDHDPTDGGFDDPTRFVQQAAGASGVLNYKFDGLEAGSYWVAAGWWEGTAFVGDPKAFGFALDVPVVLDPNDPEKSRVDFVDVYVGRCDPDGPGVEGEVLVAEPFQAMTISVALLDRPLRTDGSTQPVGAAFGIGTGERRTFAICSDPGAPAYLIANATPVGDEQAATVVSHPANTLELDTLQHLTLSVGVPDPTLGSITGTIRPSSPLPDASVTVLLTDEPPSESSPILAMTKVVLGEGTEFEYALHGLADATYYVSALVKTADGFEAFVQSGTGRIAADAKEATVDIDISAARVTGTIVVINPPETIGKIAVAATKVGEEEPSAFTTVSLGTADGTGTRTASYTLFGLKAGEYDISGVVDYAGDGEFEDDYALAFADVRVKAGNPSRVTVSATESPVSNLAFDLTSSP